jgi:hypothetical protein
MPPMRLVQHRSGPSADRPTNTLAGAVAAARACVFVLLCALTLTACEDPTADERVGRTLSAIDGKVSEERAKFTMGQVVDLYLGAFSSTFLKDEHWWSQDECAQAAKSILPVLGELHALKCLDMNNVDLEGACEFTLPKSLETLGIMPSATQPPAREIGELPYLRYLILEGENVDDAYLQALLDARGDKPFDRLRLEFSPVSEEQFADMVNGGVSREWVIVRCPRIGNELVDRLRQQHKIKIGFVP